MTDIDSFEPLSAPWANHLEDAIQEEFKRKKDKNKGPDERQYFVVEKIEFWGNNPVREYRVTASSIPEPPG